MADPIIKIDSERVFDPMSEGSFLGNFVLYNVSGGELNNIKVTNISSVQGQCEKVGNEETGIFTINKLAADSSLMLSTKAGGKDIPSAGITEIYYNDVLLAGIKFDMSHIYSEVQNGVDYYQTDELYLYSQSAPSGGPTTGTTAITADQAMKKLGDAATLIKSNLGDLAYVNFPEA